MIKQMPFIGRDNELMLITQSIIALGKRKAIFVNGPGGIGKTRLLQEVFEQFEHSDSHLRLTQMIDLDDPSFRNSEGVGLRIAEMVGESFFEGYLQSMRDWHKMERACVSLEGLEYQSKIATEKFIDNFNQAIITHRCVLFFDTVEKLWGTELWEYISNLISNAKNATFILAGRNALGLGESLKEELGEDLTIINLLPLSLDDCKLYLEKKQKLLHVVIDPDISEKLLILAHGRPILIDLAIEWISRNLPIDWMVEKNLDEIKNLSEDELHQLQIEFESRIVSPIIQVRANIDRLTLLMSRVYPLDAETMQHLLNISNSQALKELENAKTYVFVKQLPDGRISLHDEMRRMVNFYVWPLLDQDQGRQRQDSRLAAEFLEQRIQAIKIRINQFQETEGADTNYKEQSLQEFLERELWVLEEQRLFHRLFVDIKKGFELFIQVHDEAASGSHPFIRGMLIEQVLEYVDQLTPQQKYELQKRQAHYLFDIANYSAAKEILTAILEQDNLPILERIDTLLLFANNEIRLGNVSKGVDVFEQADRLVLRVEDPAIQAKVKNGVGWGHRRMGQFSKAVDYYNEALSLIGLAEDKLENHTLEGDILNNMVYVYSRLEFKGLADSALDIGIRAEKVWKKIGDNCGLGNLYIAYMTVYKRRRVFEEMLRYGDLAWSIFESVNDVANLSVICYERGVANWNLKRFAESEIQFKKALSYDIKLYIPDNLYWLAETYISTGQLTLAKEYSGRGLSVAFHPRDSRYHLYLLAQQAHIFCLLKQFDKIEELLEKYMVYQAYVMDTKREEPAAEGLFYYFLGILALQRFCDNRNLRDWAENSIRYFKESFPKIAKHVVYGDYPLPKLLLQLEADLNKFTDPDWLVFRRDLGNALRTTWDTTLVNHDTNLSKRYPYAISFFDDWRHI